MGLVEYVEACEVVLLELEDLERYEDCAWVRDVILSIRRVDELGYFRLVFDRDVLLSEGYCKGLFGYVSDRRLMEGYKAFNGYDVIFEYGMLGSYCPVAGLLGDGGVVIRK